MNAETIRYCIQYSKRHGCTITSEAERELSELEFYSSGAYALGIYKGTDGILRNSWQGRVEQLEAENKNLQKLLNESIKQVWHDRM